MARRRKKRRKFSWYLIWVLIFTFFSVVSLLLFSTLPVWQIETIRVEGNRFVSKSEIVKIGEKFLGENIFLVNKDDIDKQVKNIPLVKSIKIKKSFPNVLIVVVEERKEAAVAVVNRESVLFDDEGIILNPYHPAFVQQNLPSIADLAVIVGLKSSDIFENKLKDQQQILLSTILRDLKKHLASESIKIDIADTDNISLIVDDIIQVKIGDSKNIDKKLNAFKSLREFEENRLHSIEYIDVVIPTSPVIKFK